METKEVRALMQAAATGDPQVNSGFTALATPDMVGGLCQGWLLMREALKDVHSAATELEMPIKDRLDYITSLAAAALAAL